MLSFLKRKKSLSYFFLVEYFDQLILYNVYETLFSLKKIKFHVKNIKQIYK